MLRAAFPHPERPLQRGEGQGLPGKNQKAVRPARKEEDPAAGGHFSRRLPKGGSAAFFETG